MEKGCKYCSLGYGLSCTKPVGSFELQVFESDTCNVDIYIEEKSRFLSSFLLTPGETEVIHTMRKINYCPMCGTDLKELYKDEE